MNKRRLRAILFVMVFFSSLIYVFNSGSEVHAVSMNSEISVINDYSSRYNYSFLSDDQKKAYDELEEKFVNSCYSSYDSKWYLNTVTLTIFDMSYETVDEVAKAFNYDHYYIYWMYTYCYSTGKAVVIKVAPNPRYNMYTENDIQNQYKEICTATVDVLKVLSEYATDEQKAYYIYKWITENASYAYDENGEPSEIPIDHSMYGNIVNKTSVCEGFAEAFSYLCTACGIENAVVTGDAVRANGDREGHAWNIVKLNGKYYLVDTTWDEAVAPEKFSYAFKALNDDNFNKTHDPNRYYNQPGEEERSTKDIDIKSVSTTLSYNFRSEIHISLKPEDSKIKVYNNGVEVSVVDNKISVMGGCKLTFVGADSRYYVFYKSSPKDENELENGVFEVGDKYVYFIYVETRNPKIKEFSRVYYTRMDTIYRDNYAETEIISDYKTVLGYLRYEITLDEKTKERAAKLKESGAYVSPAFDENYLEGPRVYKLVYSKQEAENDGFDTSSDFPYYETTFNYTVNSCTINLANQNGIEARAYTEDGKRIYSGSKVPCGTRVYLKAFSEDGEVKDAFLYTDFKVKDQEINSDGFIACNSSTTITPKSSVLSITKIDYEDSVKVKNGTLPYPELLGLSTSAVVKTEEGLKKSFPIKWDLSNYDYRDKSDRDVVVTGEVVITNGTYTLKDGLSLNIEAKLKISGASEFKSLETEIPSKITVPAGTDRNPYSLGLPIAAEFKDKNGDILLSEIVWTAGEGNPYEMIGVVNKAGYTYDPIKVEVTEEGEQLSLVPTVSVDFSINNTKGTVLSSIDAESVIAHITVQSIKDHKDRIIKVSIPKGFTDAGVANATLLEGVNSVKVKNNDDDTANVYVEVDDSFRDGYLTFDVTFKTIFDNGDLDTGRLYPAFSAVPVIINYEAVESGEKKSADLAYGNHLTLGGGIEFMVEPTYTGYLSLSVPYKNYQNKYYLPNYKFRTSKKQTYLKNYQVIYPINDNFYCDVKTHQTNKSSVVFDEDTNCITYSRNDDYVYDKSSNYDGINDYTKHNVEYNLHAKDNDKLNYGFTYTSDKNVYVRGEDYFGNEYIRTFNNKMSLYIYPIDENSNVTLDVCPYSLVMEGTDYYGFDLKFEAVKSIDKVSFKPINDMQLRIEIPDGTTVSGIGELSSYKSIEFIYHDNSSKIINHEDIRDYKSQRISAIFLQSPDNYEDLSINKESYSYIRMFDNYITNKKGDGIKEIIFTIDPITDTYKDELTVLLSGTYNYPDGKRVDYGNQFKFKGSLDDYETDCPVAEMPVYLHTEYADYEAMGHTIHILETNNSYRWRNYCYYNEPFKSLKKDIFTGRDEYVLEADGIPINEDTLFYDNIISSELINDSEVFEITKLSIPYPSCMRQNKDLESKISIKCSDGKTYEYDYDAYQKFSFDAPEGTSILGYVISIDELVVSDGNKFIVDKEYKINWDKWVEKGYKADQYYMISDATAVSRDVEEGGSSCSLKVRGDVTSSYSYSYTSLQREYDNKDTQSITAISSFDQLDGCTEKYSFHYATRLNFGTKGADFGVAMPIYYNDLVIGVTTGNKELRVSDKDMPKLYDKEGNVVAVAEEIEYMPITASGTYYSNIGTVPMGAISEMLCKIHFKNVTLADGDYREVVYRIEPTSNVKAGTYTSMCNVIGSYPNLEVNRANWAKLYPADVHTIYNVSSRTNKMTERYYTMYQSQDINVLTAYSENAVMFGKSAANDDKTATSYNVEIDETYDAILHLFAGAESKFNSFEAVINVPKADSKLTVNGKTYKNAYDSVFSKVAVTSGVVNPKYYYLKNSGTDSEPEYVEFSGNAVDVEKPEEIISIKVTADKVNNNDEITLSLTAPETKTEEKTYIYSDITYNDGTRSVKTIKTNVVEFVLSPGLSTQPTGTPEPSPSVKPTATIEPSATPTAEPTSEATPTAEPTPTEEPTATPTPEAKPTAEPTSEATPTAEPTAIGGTLGDPTPTAEPTADPTPTLEPTPTEEPTPTATPTEEPTPSATPTATVEPTSEVTPGGEPTPTGDPLGEPTPTVEPSATPTAEPTEEPTPEPTPTEEPTAAPTEEPTAEPTPEATPTVEPTAEITPTAAPTESPAVVTPTDEPISEVTTEDGSSKKVKNANSKKDSGDDKTNKKTSVRAEKDKSSDTKKASQATVDDSGNTNTSGTSNSVKTGDTIPIIPIILLMLISIIGIVFIIHYKKKNED